MKRLFYYLKKIIIAKWEFKLPQKKKILLYDGEGDHIMKLFFDKDLYHILNTRFEKINLTLIFKAFIKKGFKNIKLNYLLEYISHVDPKVVLAVIDNYLRFYTLKHYYKKAKFISVQLSQRDKVFYNQCRNFYKQNKINLTVDDFFVLSKNEKDRLSKFIHSNFYVIGTLKNNFFKLIEKKESKNKKVLFITPKYPTDSEIKKKEKNIFDELFKICSERGWKLSLCTKNSKKNSVYVEKEYRKLLVQGNWKFISGNKPNSSYIAVNESDLIIFTDSTLGFEALAKKKKCLAFPPYCFPFPNFNKKFSEKGPFWSLSFSREILLELLEKVQKFSKKEWDDIIKLYLENIISYDPGNRVFKNYFEKLEIKIKS